MGLQRRTASLTQGWAQMSLRNQRLLPLGPVTRGAGPAAPASEALDTWGFTVVQAFCPSFLSSYHPLAIRPFGNLLDNRVVLLLPTPLEQFPGLEWAVIPPIGDLAGKFPPHGDFSNILKTSLNPVSRFRRIMGAGPWDLGMLRLLNLAFLLAKLVDT